MAVDIILSLFVFRFRMLKSLRKIIFFLRDFDCCCGVCSDNPLRCLFGQ